MRKIGILGGVGPQATAFIYEKLIEAAQVNHGAKNNNDYPDVLVQESIKHVGLYPEILYYVSNNSARWARKVLCPPTRSHSGCTSSKCYFR